MSPLDKLSIPEMSPDDYEAFIRSLVDQEIGSSRIEGFELNPERLYQEMKRAFEPLRNPS